MAALIPSSSIAPTGLVVRVRGSVVDVEFSGDALPALSEALIIDWDGAYQLVIEVEEHLDPHTVRAVAMQNTAGLQRGCAVRRTGGPISVPVGEKVLGRLINVVGEPIDALGAFASDVPRWPIHRAAPAFNRQDSTREVFQTGIKVIDLLAPLAKGGKAGMFGGAGVGKTVLITELIRTTVEKYWGSRSSLGSANDRVKGTSCWASCASRACSRARRSFLAR